MKFYLFALLMRPTSASETVLNEIMMQASRSLWATSRGSVENPVNFTVCSDSKNCGPRPLLLWWGTKGGRLASQDTSHPGDPHTRVLYFLRRCLIGTTETL